MQQDFVTEYDEAIEGLARLRIDLIKESSFEFMGIDCGLTDNDMDYYNYLANNPIPYYVPGGVGGGDGEWVWVADGTGENIQGKKIGVFGDSLLDNHEAAIKRLIEGLGGIPVCTQNGGKYGIMGALKNGCSLVGGAAFLQFNSAFSKWEEISSCDHIITELGVNDFYGDMASGKKDLGGYISAMNNCAGKLKGKVHLWGVVPLAWTQMAAKTIASGETVMKNIKQWFTSDEQVTSHIQSIQQSQCAALKWHYVDNKSIQCYNKIHENSQANAQRGTDAIHVTAGFFDEWFSQMLKITFGGGHWEWRPRAGGAGGGGFGGSYGSAGCFTGKSYEEKCRMAGITSEMQQWKGKGNPYGIKFKEMTGMIDTVKFPQYGGTGSLDMNKACHGDFIAICNEIMQLGWFKLKLSNSWRPKNSISHSVSRHCFGVAVDINVSSSHSESGNPWFAIPRGQSMPQTEPAAGSAPPFSCKMYATGPYDRSTCVWSWDHPVVKIFEAHGWGWGGRYGDVMHFSILNGG